MQLALQCLSGCSQLLQQQRQLRGLAEPCSYLLQLDCLLLNVSNSLICFGFCLVDCARDVVLVLCQGLHLISVPCLILCHQFADGSIQGLSIAAELL